MPKQKKAKRPEKKRPVLKLIQGGKSEKAKKNSAPKETPKPTAQETQKRMHPFSQFINKGRPLGGGKLSSRGFNSHYQIPRRKVG